MFVSADTSSPGTTYSLLPGLDGYLYGAGVQAAAAGNLNIQVESVESDFVREDWKGAISFGFLGPNPQPLVPNLGYVRWNFSQQYDRRPDNWLQLRPFLHPYPDVSLFPVARTNHIQPLPNRFRLVSR